MAYQLQEALASDSIVLVSKELADAIFSNREDGPSQCREGQMLAALTVDAKPALSAPSQRRKLFETMLKFGDGRREPQFRESVRYLLHGRADRFSATESLLVQADSGHDVWWRIAQISLTALDHKWRIVDPIFSVVMSAEDRREFAIEIVDPDVAGQLAASVAPDTFCSLRPSEAEYAALLGHIVDDDLLKRLPIHQDIEDNFVSLTDRSFWQGKWSLPAELQHTASILKRARDELTWNRQQRLVPPLDALAVIDIALARPEPERYWSLIMDCLAEANPLPEAIIVRLKSTAWAPQSNGMAVKPEDVLHLPRLNDDVARLVAEYPGVFVDPDALTPAIRSHSAFATFLAKVVPGISEALEMLGTLLLEGDRNAVGNAEISFEDWLAAFQADDGTVFPQIGLLRAVSAKLPNAAESTFVVLQIPISESRTRQLLAFLRTTHVKERSNSRRKTVVRVFGQYLRQFLANTDYRVGINDTDLPNSDGGWKSPSLLCLTNDGVSPSCVVDQQIEDQIASFLPPALQTETPFLADGTYAGSSLNFREPDWNVPAAAERLREYFDTWRALVPNEQIGGFLALLGDDASMRELAQDFLGRNRTLEETREKFGLPEVQCGRDPRGVPIMEDAQTMIRKQRVVVEIADEPTVRVLNLFGDEISAPRNDRPATLFVGYGNRNSPFPHRMDQGLRLRCFRLNAIDPNAFSEADLSRLLRDSAVKFIGEAYNSWESQTRFAATWDELAASDQLDIRIAQSLILDSAFEKLIAYGLRCDPTLCPLLDEWRGAKKRQVEHELGGASIRPGSSERASNTLQAVSTRLVALLELDAAVQTSVLNAVRSQVHNRYQYQPSSIPFELFQNADDAYGELHDHFTTSKTIRETPLFAVRAQGSVLSFVHLGRRINQYPVGRDIGTLGFDDDLWKMGCLHLSDKENIDHRASTRTGKFGIGFKSVFLACDRPRLLSGRMAFEFLGGIYPQTLPGDQRQSLYALREQEVQNDSQSTIIELVLREGIVIEQVMHRFVSLVHIQVVFAHHIRRCCVDGGAIDAVWQPEDVPHVTGCQTGEVRPAKSDDATAAPHRVLHFKSDAGALLFAIGSRAFEPFVSHIPTVWVTAPTEEELQLGFLVNGPFVVDVGRAQLARDPAHNRDAAQRLGQRFGKQLTEFFSAFSAPSSRMEIRNVLRFASDVKSFDIWSSLWERLVVAVSERASNDQPADQLIRDVLWQSSDSGVASFYSQFEAIPVRLPGKLFESELVSLANVRFSVRGALAQRDRRPEFDGYALACIRNWPTFRERVGSGKLVSHERVVRPLERLCPSLVQNITPVSLADVLRWECPHPMIDPEKA
ncbi:MAG: hypothetical protein O2856_11520, partial [Planctomycetota bacterium]|nr:hypothetical protein [Planctomycetota bacterium]